MKVLFHTLLFYFVKNYMLYLFLFNQYCFNYKRYNKGKTQQYNVIY